MVFTTTCFGESRIADTLHLLNDLRNLDYTIYVITNQNLKLEYFQFQNVEVKKIDTDYYHDFYRYEIILDIIEQSNDSLIYYLDCDSRFINFRYEKFDKDKFEEYLECQDFDIMTAWFNDPIDIFFERPDENERKNTRQFKYGYDSIIEYMENKFPKYEEYLNLNGCMEGHLIFRNSDKLKQLLEEILEISKIIISEDLKNNRQEIGCTSSALITLLSKKHDLKIVRNDITHHFFKANFLKEVFPFNFKIDKNEKVFIDNN